MHDSSGERKCDVTRVKLDWHRGWERERERERKEGRERKRKEEIESEWKEGKTDTPTMLGQKALQNQKYCVFNVMEIFLFEPKEYSAHYCCSFHRCAFVKLLIRFNLNPSLKTLDARLFIRFKHSLIHSFVFFLSLSLSLLLFPDSQSVRNHNQYSYILDRRDAFKIERNKSHCGSERSA